MVRTLTLLAIGAAALTALLLWGAWRVSRMARELHDQEMGLLDHLKELRYRVLASLAVAGVTTIVLFMFDIRSVTLYGYQVWAPIPSVDQSLAARLLDLVLAFVLPERVTLVVLDPSEAILAQIQAALLGGLVLASPMVAYHVAAFVAPALHPSELRVVGLLAPLSLVLFLAGAAFGFLVITPLTLDTLYAYAEPFGAATLAQPQGILSFTLLTTALFGVAFQLPLVMGGLSYLGLMHPSTMGRHWRGVVVTCMILGAILSDPSPVTQLMLAGPLVLLYVLGLGTARLAWRAGGHGRSEGQAASA